MAKNKTKETAADVVQFLDKFVGNDLKKQESKELIKFMQEVTGFPPKMWGPSIIGFGSYHYKYASGHEGDAPLAGFSPRKAAISLYISYGVDHQAGLLSRLGRFKAGKACIYINKLSDIDLSVMSEIIFDTITYIQSKYD